MCDHFDCHGSKVLIYRATDVVLLGKTREEDELLPPMWFAALGDKGNGTLIAESYVWADVRNQVRAYLAREGVEW